MSTLIHANLVQKSRDGRHAFEGLAAAVAGRKAVFTSSILPLRPVAYAVVGAQDYDQDNQEAELQLKKKKIMARPTKLTPPVSARRNPV